MGTFLLILKIIGITLASIIGLLLLVILLILFVPIRYGGNGEYPYVGNKLPADLHAKITWLLRFVHVSFDTDANGQILKVKVLGLTIYSNDPEYLAKKAEKEKKKQDKLREKKRKKKEKAAAKRKKEKEKRKKKMEANKSKNASQKDKEFKKWDKKHKKDKKKASGVKSDVKGQSSASNTKTSEKNKSSSNDSLGSLDRAYFDSDAAKKLKDEKLKKSEEEGKEAAENKEKTGQDSNANGSENSKNAGSSEVKEKKAARPGSIEYLREHTGVDDSKKKSEIYEKNVKIFDDDDESQTEDSGDLSEEDEENNDTKKKSVFEKILEKLKSIVKIPQKIYNKVRGLYRKFRKYKDFIDDSRVRKAVSYIIKKIKLVLKRVLPRKLNGNAVIGMADPATTGFIMAGLSLFYKRWAGHFDIQPDFTEKRIEAKGDFKGRIYLIGIVIPALKVWLNKDVKYLRKQLDKIKEDTGEAPDSEDNKENDESASA